MMNLNSCKKQNDTKDFILISNFRISNIAFSNEQSSDASAGDSLIITFNLSGSDELDSLYIKASTALLTDSSFNLFSLIHTENLSGKSRDVSFLYVLPDTLDPIQKHEILIEAQDINGLHSNSLKHLFAIQPSPAPYSSEISSARVYNVFSLSLRDWNLDSGVSQSHRITGNFLTNTTSVSDTAILPGGFRPGLSGPFPMKIAEAGYDYDNASEGSAEYAYQLAPASADPSYGVAVGSIVIMKIEPYRKYIVINITDIVQTLTDCEDYIEFSYKK